MVLAVKDSLHELDRRERRLRYAKSLVRYDKRYEPKRALDEALKALEKLEKLLEET